MADGLAFDLPALSLLGAGYPLGYWLLERGRRGLPIDGDAALLAAGAGMAIVWAIAAGSISVASFARDRAPATTTLRHLGKWVLYFGGVSLLSFYAFGGVVALLAGPWIETRLWFGMTWIGALLGGVVAIAAGGIYHAVGARSRRLQANCISQHLTTEPA